MESGQLGKTPSLIPDFRTFQKILKDHKLPVLIPLSITLPRSSPDPSALFTYLTGGDGFLLESMEGVPRRAVRSIIGYAPDTSITIYDSIKAEGPLSALFTNNTRDPVSQDPITLIRYIAEQVSSPISVSEGFSGGLVGYCRYDMIDKMTGGMVRTGTDGGPLARFMLGNQVVVIDHVLNTTTVVSCAAIQDGDDPEEKYSDAESLAYEIVDKIHKAPVDMNSVNLHTERVDLPVEDKEAFESIVRSAVEHIEAGDIFQVVLSRKFSIPYTKDPYRIYQVLRSLNPSPYLYYLNFHDEYVIGSSPEMLIKVEGLDLTTVPIAGTRPRGKTPKEDDQLAAELLGDEKELAEHLMLVDLARNDIGKVSTFGTVRVSEYMNIEKFSHVQHIVSTVNGELSSDLDRIDAFASCFPAGTVSGAPKIRAMQIISELESAPRGIYAGAVGYIGFDNRLEFAITIRTVIVKDGVARFQSGAGIVADSVPEKEFEETQRKAAAMAAAIAAAEVMG